MGAQRAALERARASGNAMTRAVHHGCVARAALDLEQLAEAEVHLTEADRQFERLGYPLGRIQFGGEWCRLHLLRAEWAEALESADEHIARSTEHGSRIGAAFGHYLRGLALVGAGRFAEAHRAVLDAAAEHEAASRLALAEEARLVACATLRASGAPDEARSALAQLPGRHAHQVVFDFVERYVEEGVREVPEGPPTRDRLHARVLRRVFPDT